MSTEPLLSPEITAAFEPDAFDSDTIRVPDPTPADPIAALAPPARRANRSIVLVGLMGAGKTTIGRRLAATLGLPFHDADAEIERAAGCSIADIFERFGESAFRDGERRVIRRLLCGEPIVLATGGGAYMDAETRALIRAEALSVWLRCSLPVLLRRVSGRTHRPLLNAGDPRTILAELIERRAPVYAEADLIVDCGDDSAETTTRHVAEAIDEHRAPRRLRVDLSRDTYEVLVGDHLIARAGAWLAPVLPQRRVFVVTDQNVAKLHLPTLLEGLNEAGFTAETIIVPPGEGSKRLAEFARVTDAMLKAGVERRTAVIALGGGVVGDLAGYAAASTMRGLPFVQIPTTLLSQVDSSVGGKTGINTDFGKNLLGAFHQPRIVLADTGSLTSLPPRERSAGYAEIIKAGLIGDAAFYQWCETNAEAIAGPAASVDPAIQAEAVLRACAFKAAVVGDDEREEKPSDGRALLNLGHTFGHALEAECGYDGSLLHGEAVAIGLVLAFRLSARLGLCDPAIAPRIAAHLERVGLPSEIGMLNRRFSAESLVANMQRDKKMRDGRLNFVLARAIGAAFTDRDVPKEAVLRLLQEETGAIPHSGN